MIVSSSPPGGTFTSALLKLALAPAASERAGGAIVQVPTFRSEEALVIDLVSEAGVLVHPGYFFDFRRESFLVLSLLPPEPSFAEGVGRLLTRVVQAV